MNTKRSRSLVAVIRAWIIAVLCLGVIGVFSIPPPKSEADEPALPIIPIWPAAVVIIATTVLVTIMPVKRHWRWLVGTLLVLGAAVAYTVLRMYRDGLVL